MKPFISRAAGFGVVVAGIAALVGVVSGGTAGTTKPPAGGRAAPLATDAAPIAHRAAVAIPSGDWPQFNFTAQRAGVGPTDTGITAGGLGQLQLRTVRLPGTA